MSCKLPQLQLHFLVFSLVSLFFGPSSVLAGEWRVSPVGIYLDRHAKSSVISIYNEGDETVNLQGKVMEWFQDQDGKDTYRESKDLLFFPRILQLESGEKKIIRVGLKVPAGSQEKTYRLFVEEIPGPREDESAATEVAVLVRFGIPVFARPVQEQQAGEIVSLHAESGKVHALVRNNGNVHFKITGITVTGRDARGEVAFSENHSGWYLLAGASRLYSLALPADGCGKSDRLEVQVQTNTDLTLADALEMSEKQCLQ